VRSSLAGVAVLAALAAGSPAGAQTTTTQTLQAPDGHRLAVDTVDPLGTSRFQLLSRSLFAHQTATSLEGRFFISLVEGFGLNGALPFAVVDPPVGQAQAFIGNVSVGISGGGAFNLGGDDPLQPSPRLGLSGGVDVYLPSAPQGAADPAALMAASRAYDPQLFLSGVFSVRTRAQVAFHSGGLRAHLELAAMPGVTTRGPTQGILLLGATARLSYAVAEVVEPFLEVSGSRQVAGGGDVAPPVMLTPGVRFHIADVFSPALFASVNFVVPEAVIFGVDLASAPGRTLEERRRAEAYEPEDVFDF
jgi:hypothetical protein